MIGGDEDETVDAGTGTGDDGAADVVDEEPSPLTAVAEPAVIDLRDGVDTIAAHEADQARRADAARDRARH